MSDNINNQSFVNQNQYEQRKIHIDKSFFNRTLKVISKPIFDFLSVPETTETVDENADYEEEIKKVEMKMANIQRTLNESDTTQRKKLNIVF